MTKENKQPMADPKKCGNSSTSANLKCLALGGRGQCLPLMDYDIQSGRQIVCCVHRMPLTLRTGCVREALSK